MTAKGVGLDFGTTNSAIAVAGDDGTVRLARFAEADRLAATFRSILYCSTVAKLYLATWTACL
jgi:hypothetical chaperone protein